jgi:hypothetical protein
MSQNPTRQVHALLARFCLNLDSEYCSSENRFTHREHYIGRFSNIWRIPLFLIDA